MPQRLKCICICLLLLSGAAPPATPSAAAFEYRLTGGLYQGLFAGRNFWDPYTQDFDRDEIYTITSIYADAYLEADSRWSGFLTGAVDWVHDFRPESRDDVDPDLLQAFARFNGDRLGADIGHQPFSFGRGLLYDDDAPGLFASWPIGDNRYLEVMAARAFDASPLVSLTVGYRPGFFEKIEITGLYLKDEDNGFADLLNRQVGLDLFSGDGELFWIGMAADIFVGEAYLSAIGFFQSGRMQATYPEPGETADFDISAYLFDVAANYNLTDTLSAGAFLFAASGDSHPGSRRFHAFVSPMPYNPRADIFFNGGVDGHDIFEGFTLAGIDWAGVIAPGIKVAFQPRSKWLAEWSTTALFPENPSDQGTWYGWETDLSITRTWGSANSAYILLGLFDPADRLAPPGGARPDLLLDMIAGVTLWF